MPQRIRAHENGDREFTWRAWIATSNEFEDLTPFTPQLRLKSATPGVPDVDWVGQESAQLQISRPSTRKVVLALMIDDSIPVGTYLVQVRVVGPTGSESVSRDGHQLVVS